ncbi:unnamed protein product [Ambrosiozyma monospora]|uniref:Presequence translocated-associated motor subunit PAM17 n=1 Tax=Ambrosiozyma monospora TaxID=43982 RepID=A0A9W6T0Z3_AMBMO|nr:unnamed protein product [Ambrosiozyma monospora]
MMFTRQIGIQVRNLSMRDAFLRPITRPQSFKTTASKTLNSIRSIRFKSTNAAKEVKPLTEKEIELASEMTWSEFLALRKKQNRTSMGGSILGAFIVTGIAWGYVSQLEFDPTSTVFGYDPFMVFVFGMVFTSCIGYVVGPPLLGDPLFRLLNRSQFKSFRVKQKLFLQHISKMRVDASRQSMNNPVPDYYGEKIGSLNDYRQWLRDCNEYRRKASDFL